jgi:hypothetical protein
MKKECIHSIHETVKEFFMKKKSFKFFWVSLAITALLSLGALNSCESMSERDAYALGWSAGYILGEILD